MGAHSSASDRGCQLVSPAARPLSALYEWTRAKSKRPVGRLARSEWINFRQLEPASQPVGLMGLQWHESLHTSKQVRNSLLSALAFQSGIP